MNFNERRDTRLVGRSLVSGTLAALATAAAASAAGRRETGSYLAPLNAVSHMIWGDEAGRRNRASARYTLTGFLLHHAASIFWAAIYEKWFAPGDAGKAGEVSPLRTLAGAAVVSAGAYVTDYHVVPRRLAPGFDMRLSGRSMVLIYGVLALGLAADSILRARRAASPSRI